MRTLSNLNEHVGDDGRGHMAKHGVVIAGGGPTGLMLAAELALGAIDVVVVERRINQEVDGSRSGGLHSRTIEILESRGVAARFLEEGQAMQIQGFAGIPLDISDFPTRHNHGLALWQGDFERIMSAWVSELGVPVMRGQEVVGFAQDDTGVDVAISGGQTLRSNYLIGCDGGRSVVRRAAGIGFDGVDPSNGWLIAEAETEEEPAFGLRRGGGGIGRAADGVKLRIVLPDPDLARHSEPGMGELRSALIAAYGTDYGVHSATWISRFTDMTRQATSYRERRVLLAGDAAHVHPPQGGQGLNTGVQDAVNLGWKLAQVVHGTSSDVLLDTYHAERHPIGARVLHYTMAQVALGGTDERTDALRAVVGELLAMDEPRKHIAATMSGLDIHYDLGEGHPLLGRRMPDLNLVGLEGPLRISELLHEAKGVLLNLDEAGRFAISAWATRVQLVEAEYVGQWELPVLGPVPAPHGVLIRPDGYVAWVGTGTDAGLRDALTTWFGPP